MLQFTAYCIVWKPVSINDKSDNMSYIGCLKDMSSSYESFNHLVQIHYLIGAKANIFVFKVK